MFEFEASWTCQIHWLTDCWTDPWMTHFRSVRSHLAFHCWHHWVKTLPFTRHGLSRYLHASWVKGHIRDTQTRNQTLASTHSHVSVGPAVLFTVIIITQLLFPARRTKTELRVMLMLLKWLCCIQILYLLLPHYFWGVTAHIVKKILTLQIFFVIWFTDFPSKM